MFALVGAATNAQSDTLESGQRMKNKPFFSKQLLLGAHRGGAFLWPENTLVAFREVAAKFPDVLIETDARLTSDGAVLLLHDKTVDRTTDGAGELAAMTFEEARKLDAGYDFTPDGGATYPYRGKGIVIPTLQEALEALPQSHFLVELKGEPQLADAAIKIINDANAANRVLLASFVPETMARARELAPDMASCYDMKTGMGLITALRSDRWTEYQPESDVLSIDQRMLAQFKITQEEVAAIRAKGIVFQMHTINTRDDMVKFLDFGADSLLTDRPDVLVEVIQERQEKFGLTGR
jgi:glycerophosphoryl diester phosphodiesterase